MNTPTDGDVRASDWLNDPNRPVLFRWVEVGRARRRVEIAIRGKRDNLAAVEPFKDGLTKACIAWLRTQAPGTYLPAFTVNDLPVNRR